MASNNGGGADGGRDGAADDDRQPTCFVAMPITTPTDYAEALNDPAHFQHVLEVLFTPALERAGFKVISPLAIGAQQIHAGIIRNLEQADLLLCDLSSLNPNVFFELGIRTSLNRPIALVKDRLTEKIPFDLTGINTHIYDETIASWALDSDIDKLAAHISAVDVAKDAGNEMWQFFGLTKNATAAVVQGDPTQAKLDLILKEVTQYAHNASVVPEPMSNELASLKRGDLVEHDNYGIGRVISVLKSAEGDEATVDFGDEFGRRYLQLRFAPIRKL